MKKNNPSRDPQNVNDYLWYYEGKKEFHFVAQPLGCDQVEFKVPFADVDTLATMLRASVGRMTEDKNFTEFTKAALEEHKRRNNHFPVHYRTGTKTACGIAMEETTDLLSIYPNTVTCPACKKKLQKIVKIPTPVDHTAPVHYRADKKTACGLTVKGLHQPTTAFPNRVTCRKCIDGKLDEKIEKVAKQAKKGVRYQTYYTHYKPHAGKRVFCGAKVGPFIYTAYPHQVDCPACVKKLKQIDIDVEKALKQAKKTVQPLIDSEKRAETRDPSGYVTLEEYEEECRRMNAECKRCGSRKYNHDSEGRCPIVKNGYIDILNRKYRKHGRFTQ